MCVKFLFDTPRFLTTVFVANWSEVPSITFHLNSQDPLLVTLPQSPCFTRIQYVIYYKLKYQRMTTPCQYTRVCVCVCVLYSFLCA